jgi:signal transduction histidine kinase
MSWRTERTSRCCRCPPATEAEPSAAPRCVRARRPKQGGCVSGLKPATQRIQPEDALAHVKSGEDKRLMDGIRQVLSSLDQTSRAMLAERTAAFQRATYVRLFDTVLIIALLFSVLIIAGVLLRRAFRSMRAAEALAEANAEQLRVSLDSLSQGISVFDAECRLVSWNHCFVELFAIPERLLQVGTPYSAFVRHDWTDEEGDFLETPEQLAAAPPETTGRSTPIVYERTRKDGAPSSCGGRRFPPAASSSPDITQRLATEQQLRQVQRLDAVGQLTGGIAHEFNNLLTVIIGNFDLLRRKSNDPAQRRSIEMAYAAAERGASLTRQLLAFARQPAARAASARNQSPPVRPRRVPAALAGGADQGGDRQLGRTVDGARRSLATGERHPQSRPERPRRYARGAGSSPSRWRMRCSTPHTPRRTRKFRPAPT